MIEIYLYLIDIYYFPPPFISLISYNSTQFLKIRFCTDTNTNNNINNINNNDINLSKNGSFIWADLRMINDQQ